VTALLSVATRHFSSSWLSYCVIICRQMDDGPGLLSQIIYKIAAVARPGLLCGPWLSA